jgi:hypothetical protein
MEQTFHILQKAREALLLKVSTLTNEQLNAIPAGFNNNIIWNLGHIVAVDQRLTYSLAGLPVEVDDFIITDFKPGTKPEKIYTDTEIEVVKNALGSTIIQLQRNYNNQVFKQVTPFASKWLQTTIDTIEGIITVNLYHEGLHSGVILKYIQLLS